MGPILFNVFVNSLDDGHSQLIHKLHQIGGVADLPEDYAAIHGHLNRLEGEANRNLMKFNKESVPPLGEEQPQEPAHGGVTHLESSSAELDLGVMVDTELNLNKWCAIATKKANSILCCIRQSITSMAITVIFLLYSVLAWQHLEYFVQLWAA